MVESGDIAPDVTLQLDDGTTRQLVSWRGQKLVLYFYPKDDTPGCTTEAQDFTAHASGFADAGTAVVGVSRDPVAKHVRFIAKYGLGIPLASDEDGSACAAFGTWIEKSLYGRKYMGVERATFLIGADGHVIQVWRGVKVKGHVHTVLAAAQAA